MAQRTVADAFNQYHNDYVKPSIESKLDANVASDTFATKVSVDEKAPNESPNLTGIPTAPTADNDTDSTQLATTEFCQNLIRRLVGSAPETLNTLVELATALNNDPKFAETIVQALDNKLNKTDAQTLYLAKTANAASASRDEQGNVIHTTYATKSEIPNVSSNERPNALRQPLNLYWDAVNTSPVAKITGNNSGLALYRYDSSGKEIYCADWTKNESEFYGPDGSNSAIIIHSNGEVRISGTALYFNSTKLA